MGQVEVEDPEKHERVAKALEQVNGLRYRYKGASKPPKKDINVDSDGDGEYEDELMADEDDERADAKAESRRSTFKPNGEMLTLDDHIERMLLRTRTVALLKIANNTADVLPDDDDDDEFDEAEEYDGYEDEDESGGSFSTRTDDEVDSDEKSDTFDSRQSGLSSTSSHTSSMQRMGSMRRPTSFRQASVRSSNASDPEAAAAIRLARKLSTFLSLPKVISYRDLEEITESLLNEPHDESDEYAHLIDEHVDSARDSMGGDSSVTTDAHGSSTRSLGFRHMAPQKSLRDLNVIEDPHDLDMQQRRLFVENAGLRRYSSKRLVSGSSRNLLHGGSQLSLNLGHGSSKQLISGSTRDLMVCKESKRSLRAGESWRSGGPGSIASLAEEAEEKDGEDDDAVSNLAGGEGVLGTTFDEHGYKQWRTEIKDDYLAWIRAKLEAKQRRRLEKQKESEKKPRWQLLYEAASKGRPTSASDDKPAGKVKKPLRQSVS